MRITSGICVWTLRAAFIVTLLVGLTKACSCTFRHPQEHYCTADFVALVKVKREAKVEGHTTAYHIKIKKEFKMTEKARSALSHGLIWTPTEDSLCGVKLNPTRYLISGTLKGEKPTINLCDLFLEWSTVTPKQRKGFRKLYQQGCHCKIKQMLYSPRISNQSAPNKNQCRWDTISFSGNRDCQRLHSFCAPSNNPKTQCDWIKSRPYRQCMKERRSPR